MNQSSQKDPISKPIGKSRFVIGGAVFIGGFLSPLLLPLVTGSNLPGNWKAILSTGLIAGLPEVGMLLAVAILGKQGFAQLKEIFFSRFRKITEPSTVSQTRYRIGLLMFFMPILFGLLQPYAEYFFGALNRESMMPVILPDLVFAASFIVLGAGFWDKIQGLFVHDSGLNSVSEDASNG